MLAQPSGCRAENPTLMFDTNMQGWGPDYAKGHPDVTMVQIEQFLTTMYKKNPDWRGFLSIRHMVRNGRQLFCGIAVP